MSRSTVAQAEVIREHGPFPGVEHVHGVAYDGRYVWFGAGDTVRGIDPDGDGPPRSLQVPAGAGTAFDGRHLFQLDGDRIRKVDPETGRVLAAIPSPGGEGCSGLAWAEGALWVGRYRERQIHQVDPETGAVLRTIESTRFVTGVTWAGDELWHGAADEDRSEIRRVDPGTGEVLETLLMPSGVWISGLEAGGDRFFCGGGASGTILEVRRPRR